MLTQPSEWVNDLELSAAVSVSMAASLLKLTLTRSTLRGNKQDCSVMTGSIIALWCAQVSRVLTQLPTLQHVCILGSPVEAELTSLEAKHPKVSFQKLPKSVMWETHTATQT